MKLYAYVDQWDWECGDGCCSEHYNNLIISRDELREDVVHSVDLNNWDGDDIIELLRKLGNEVME